MIFVKETKVVLKSGGEVNARHSILKKKKYVNIFEANRYVCIILVWTSPAPLDEHLRF